MSVARIMSIKQAWQHTYHQYDQVNCDICQKVFPSKHNLKLHKLSHRSLEERTLHCDSCDATFITASGLRVHCNVHHGRKVNAKYECETCNLSFKTHGAMSA